MFEFDYTVPPVRNIINKNFGSKHTAYLITRLECLFHENPLGFLKFLAPCKHYLYKEGGSWTEELDYSRQVFNKTFDLIGVRHPSKTEFLKTNDMFQSKLYASYYDRQNNQMYFVRNDKIAESYLSQFADIAKLSLKARAVA